MGNYHSVQLQAAPVRRPRPPQRPPPPRYKPPPYAIPANKVLPNVPIMPLRSAALDGPRMTNDRASRFVGKTENSYVSALFVAQNVEDKENMKSNDLGENFSDSSMLKRKKRTAPRPPGSRRPLPNRRGSLISSQSSSSDSNAIKKRRAPPPPLQRQWSEESLDSESHSVHTVEAEIHSSVENVGKSPATVAQKPIEEPKPDVWNQLKDDIMRIASERANKPFVEPEKQVTAHMLFTEELSSAFVKRQERRKSGALKMRDMDYHFSNLYREKLQLGEKEVETKTQEKLVESSLPPHFQGRIDGTPIANGNVANGHVLPDWTPEQDLDDVFFDDNDGPEYDRPITDRGKEIPSFMGFGRQEEETQKYRKNKKKGNVRKFKKSMKNAFDSFRKHKLEDNENWQIYHTDEFVEATKPDKKEKRTMYAYNEKEGKLVFIPNFTPDTISQIVSDDRKKCLDIERDIQEAAEQQFEEVRKLSKGVNEEEEEVDLHQQISAKIPPPEEDQEESQGYPSSSEDEEEAAALPAPPAEPAKPVAAKLEDSGYTTDNMSPTQPPPVVAPQQQLPPISMPTMMPQPAPLLYGPAVPMQPMPGMFGAGYYGSLPNGLINPGFGLWPGQYNNFMMPNMVMNPYSTLPTPAMMQNPAVSVPQTPPTPAAPPVASATVTTIPVTTTQPVANVAPQPFQPAELPVPAAPPPPPPPPVVPVETTATTWVPSARPSLQSQTSTESAVSDPKRLIMGPVGFRPVRFNPHAKSVTMPDRNGSSSSSYSTLPSPYKPNTDISPLSSPREESNEPNMDNVDNSPFSSPREDATCDTVAPLQITIGSVPVVTPAPATSPVSPVSASSSSPTHWDHLKSEIIKAAETRMNKNAEFYKNSDSSSDQADSGVGEGEVLHDNIKQEVAAL